MRTFLILLFLAAWGLAASAAEFRSVDAQAAILYDAPSAKGKKLYLIKPLTPVEVLVKLDGWVKVRDAEGALAWVQAPALTEKRMLVVTSPKGEMRQAERPDASIVAELDKWVAVELIETGAAGWAKVRHRDGATGYMRSTQVWGL